MSRARRPPLSDTVVKTLFALSRNVCAHRDPDRGYACEEALTDPNWVRVKGEIAHIRGLLPGSARHDPSYDDPNCFENLTLMCPNHHTTIDDLQPDRYTIALLEEMKSVHESVALTSTRWASDARLETVVAALIVQTQRRLLAEELVGAELATAEMQQVLAQSINRLPDREKIVLTLRHYEHLHLAEIAEVLGVSRSTASRSYRKAIGFLRERLELPPGSDFPFSRID